MSLHKSHLASLQFNGYTSMPKGTGSVTINVGGVIHNIPMDDEVIQDVQILAHKFVERCKKQAADNFLKANLMPAISSSDAESSETTNSEEQETPF